MGLRLVDRAAMWGDSRSRAGFTLLELMVVMTLLAVMSLIVTPVFRGSFGSMRADRAMRDLFAAMKAAQSGAVTEALEYRVYLEPERARYWVEHAIPPEGGGVPAELSRGRAGKGAGSVDGAHTERGGTTFEPLPGRAGEVVELPDTVELQRPRARQGRGGQYYVSFFPSGACDVAEVEAALVRDAAYRYRIDTTGTRVRFEVVEP